MLTVLLTYCCDCYPDKASEVAIVFQFFINVLAYIGPFYTPDWIEADGAKAPYLFYAWMPVVFAPLGLGLVAWRGSNMRAKGPWFTL
jgi:hypothetical protein